MKILLIADIEQTELWGIWKPETAELMKDIELILSAGDLSTYYLEYLVTMTNVPLLYVRGNHDGFYDEKPPEGCVCIEDSVVVLERTAAGYLDIRRDDPVSRIAGALKRRKGQAAGDTAAVRIAGLGGSMRYRDGGDMYTEEEMAQRVRKLSRNIRRSRRFPDGRGPAGTQEVPDILLTHAPCRGFGDMTDLPHTGFECFNSLLREWKPLYHCYGHVHLEYGHFRRTIQHPSGTTLINCNGHYILEI